MEKLVKGDVVVMPFPFSDLSSSRKRPAVVAATLSGDDIVCCQVTSKERYDKYSLYLDHAHFKVGHLPQESMIRPNKLFTADNSIILYKAGSLKDEKTKEMENVIVRLFTQ